jgi:hypothetical protein
MAEAPTVPTTNTQEALYDALEPVIQAALTSNVDLRDFLGIALTAYLKSNPAAAIRGFRMVVEVSPLDPSSIN